MNVIGPPPFTTFTKGIDARVIGSFEQKTGVIIVETCNRVTVSLPLYVAVGDCCIIKLFIEHMIHAIHTFIYQAGGTNKIVVDVRDADLHHCYHPSVHTRKGLC